MYELQGSYADGYQQGNAIADHHFYLWQDAKGPPFPWPQGHAEISTFIESCLPMMHTVVAAKIARDARETGIDPGDIAIPRSYLEGLETGYRSHLTELLQQLFLRKAGLDLSELWQNIDAYRLRLDTIEKREAEAREQREKEARDRDRRDREAAHWNYWHNPANPWNNPDNTSNQS